MSLYTPDERKVIAAGQRIRREKRAAANKANNARKPAEKRHRGRVVDAAHLGFIRRLPCVACQAPAPSDAAHLRMADHHRGKPATGMAVKPSDCWTTPLCRTHHTAQHAGSEARFWAELGIDAIDLCQRLYAVSGDTDAGLQIIMENGR